MKKNIKIFAFIFVRGGSIRLKNKNILSFNNKPLFMNSVDQAKKILNINKIFVSSDSKKIETICRNKKYVEFIKRPKKLATSTSKEILAWKHALKFVEKKYGNFDYFLSLPATNPLRKLSDIKKFIKKCENRNKNKIFISISKLKKNILENIVFKSEKKIVSFKKKFFQRSIKKNLFTINGSIYLTKKENIEKIKKNIFDLNVIGIETNPNNSIDIDDINDFKIAKSLLSR
jgi:CMP-N-acetylneuraminic acid synthetase